MESVNATGLGAIDYKAAGSNVPNLTFNNQQNYFGLNANVDLRGTGADNALLANTGNDTVEGRGGDDVMSGNVGKDMFVESFGDGVD
jgi:Ca2+-binding RTX toxin-like protein